MKKKTTINWVISTLIILLFLVVPKEVVWGGNSNQTVPTISPSLTATTANAATQVAPTNTQVASTQPANTNPTSTNTGQAIAQPTSTRTLQPTGTQAVATETAQDVSNETSGEDTEATSSVSLPLVSAGEDEKAGDQQAEEASQPEVVTTLPSFVLPLLAVLLLVIVYLIIRITSKKASDKK